MRPMLSHTDYGRLRREFRWNWPARLNMAHQAIGDWAPAPKVMKARKESPPETRNAPAPVETEVEPRSNEVTGFVFKVQANMDPNHRDRIAMFRMASGAFKRGMKLKVQNTGKSLSVNAPIMFFASDRELADDAFAGDVIGIPNHGVLRVGDSLSESGVVRFAGLPNFAPEILQRVRVKDPLKAKHLKKALEGLAEEGVTQLFRPELGADFIVGAVGQLQFEVMADRLGEEYGLDVVFEPSPYAEARWIGGADADVEQDGVEGRAARLPNPAARQAREPQHRVQPGRPRRAGRGRRGDRG